MPTSMYAVEGMVCESCMAAVVENVQSLSGVTVVAMDLVTGGQSPLLVTSGTTLGADSVRHAVEHVGFGVLAAVVANASRLRGFQNTAIPDDAGLSASDPVVKVGRDQERGHDVSEKSSKETDLVCGMTVDPTTAAASVEHQGRTYYFCGEGCAVAFRVDPGKYVNAAVS